jgi:hypothetical protein
MNPVLMASALVCLAGVAACAAPDAAVATATPPSEARLLVKLAHPASDGAAIAREVGASAGVPARYLSSSSAQWHVVVLRCASSAECDAAVQRLRADTARIEAVQPDQRMRPAAP